MLFPPLLPDLSGSLPGLVLMFLGRGPVSSLVRASSLSRRPSGGMSGSMDRSRISSAAWGNLSGSSPARARLTRACTRATWASASAVALMPAALRALRALMISGSPRTADETALVIRATLAATAASTVMFGLWANARVPSHPALPPPIARAIWVVMGWRDAGVDGEAKR
jgi:predicted secreted protein